MEEQTQLRTTSSARLRFVLDGGSRDVALPAEVPLADLLPAILPLFGADVVEEGAEHEGWVVQRIGEKPLDEDRTLTELNVFDGESLHLRPRAGQLAAVDYDDLVDGVGEVVREHAGRITPERARWMFRAGAAVSLGIGLLALLQGPMSGMQAVVASVVALVLLLSATLVARGAGRSEPATVLAVAGVCCAAAAGFSVAQVLDPGANAMVLLSGAAAGALLALVTGVVAIADAVLLFTGGIVFSAVLGVAGLVGALSPLTTSESAAIAVSASVVVAIFVPHLAFRLSGLTLPMLPTGANELGEDIEPVSHDLVNERGAVTFSYVTSLYVGLGAAQCVLLPLLVVGGDTWSIVLALVIALLLLLRSRHPAGLVARCSILAPVAVVIAAVVLYVSAVNPAAGRLLVVVPLVTVAALLFLFGAERLPGTRLRPYWGRAVEILESLTAMAVLPVLLQVLHVYALMRALAG
ncbi:type VII secretion integral membrane protein EccD [Lentzea sp. NBRC 102530]|uniref:type VII secretion integral membrane protein EccD n=1 Tax=Lentzea sp. NBRC 102530 TaxID=3032201 RepID=UPI0025566639|nr:type VII secretion integral membrane protein EccD [Lentzea sp. NBRC 102530]